jgi:hypothetical protein
MDQQNPKALVRAKIKDYKKRKKTKLVNEK